MQTRYKTLSKNDNCVMKYQFHLLFFLVEYWTIWNKLTVNRKLRFWYNDSCAFHVQPYISICGCTYNDTYLHTENQISKRYVNVQSNHPRYVVNQVPKSINKRLTTISKNESSFNRAKQHYQKKKTKGKIFGISRHHFVCR